MPVVVKTIALIYRLLKKSPCFALTLDLKTILGVWVTQPGSSNHPSLLLSSPYLSLPASLSFHLSLPPSEEEGKEEEKEEQEEEVVEEEEEEASKG